MSLLLVLAFLVVPIIEIFVIVQVGQQIGALPTIALLLLESALGAWIVRREGSRAWRALRGAIGTGQLPSRELADAALVLVGGTLLLTPGFLTDVVGFFCVLPLTRPLARRLLSLVVARRAATAVSQFGVRGASFPPGRGSRGGGPTGGDPTGDASPRPPTAAPPGGRIVQGEIVDDEPLD